MVLLFHVHSSILLSTEYTECQSFRPVIRIGPPTPSSFESKGGDTLAGGGGGGETQFQRRVYTLCTVNYNPSTVVKYVFYIYNLSWDCLRL
jgi:hypothetical protein